MGFALAMFLLVAPFATAQTDTPTDPIVDTTPVKRPPVTDPPPPTDPPATTPPATKPPVVSPPPAPAPAPRTVTPFVPSGSSSLGRTTTTTKPKNAKQSQLAQQSVATPAAGATAATPAPTTAPAADPAQTPATDPLVKVAGKEVSRQATSAQLIAAGPDSGGGDPTLTTVLLIGAVAVLPVIGAVALTGRDTGKWLRGAGRDA